MNSLFLHALRRLLLFAIVVCGLFLIVRYPGEWRLARASDSIDATLLGKVYASQRSQVVNEALALTEAAAWQLPHDARRELVAASARTILGRGQEAIDGLLPEVVRAERPELVVALGRAYASVGDEANARAAFLRAGWAAPASLATLPKSVREALSAQVATLEADLQAGRLTAPPPLPTARASSRSTQ